MKVKRIIMRYSDYCLPNIKEELNEEMNINLGLNTFCWKNYIIPFNNIKKIGFNIFAIESNFKLYDFCFKPKWYQFLKFYSYFYYKKLIYFIKFIIN